MKTVIVCTSVSHGNTARIAEAMGDVLTATVVAPEQLDADRLRAFDLVGFGSGIFYGSFHPRLRAFVDALPPRRGGRAFTFATSGFAPDWQGFTPKLTRVLDRKGFDVVDSFNCRGHDTFGPFKLVGGLRKGRPGEPDLAAAREFARGLRVAVRAR